MNFNNLTDFELNKAVAEKVFKDLPSLFVARDVETRDRVTVFMEIEGELVSTDCVDYVNSWSDAGQLIEQCGITVIQLMCGKWAAISRFELDKDNNPLPRFSATDASVLRAAMIVYLQIEEKFDE